MKFDELLHSLGEFGTFQKRVYVLVCLASTYQGLVSMVLVFLTINLPHRCHIYNETQLRNSSLNIVTPVYFSENLSNSSQYGQCFMQGSNSSKVTCNKWIYTPSSPMETNIISHFDIVCQHKIWRSYIRMMYYAGQIISCVIQGYLSDRFGRKRVLIASLIIRVVFGSLEVLSPNRIVFGIFTAVQAGAGFSAFNNAFHIGMEYVGIGKRFHAGTVIEYFFVFGTMIVTGVAYGVRNWVPFDLICTLPGVLFIAYYWLMPESPRWLLATNKTNQARKIIAEMCRVNKVKVEFIEPLEAETKTDLKIWHLLRRRKITIWIIVNFINWLSVAFAYHGINLNIGDLSGNLHLNLFLSSVFEAIGYLLSHLVINRLGRKWVYIVSMLLTGLCCIATIFPHMYLSSEYQWVIILLALIGKLAISSAFGVIYIHVTEITPTCIRAEGLSYSAFFSRIGAMVSPYIVDIKSLVENDFGEVLPLVIFGSTSLTGALLYTVMPETLGKPLPETIDDTANLDRKNVHEEENEHYALKKLVNVDNN